MHELDTCWECARGQWCQEAETAQTQGQALRYNAGKVDFTLIPVDAMEEEAKVWAVGEKKYSRNNWEKLWGEDTVRVVTASILRHTMAILRGETRDPETGLLHASHLRCNAAMLIRYNLLQEAASVHPDSSF